MWQFYLVTQQSLPADHLETVTWYLILHIAPVHTCFITYSCVDMCMGHVTTQNKHYFDVLAYLLVQKILYYCLHMVNNYLYMIVFTV